MDMAIAKYMWVVHNAVAQPSTTNLIRQTDLYCRVCVCALQRQHNSMQQQRPVAHKRIGTWQLIKTWRLSQQGLTFSPPFTRATHRQMRSMMLLSAAGGPALPVCTLRIGCLVFAKNYKTPADDWLNDMNWQWAEPRGVWCTETTDVMRNIFSQQNNDE